MQSPPPASATSVHLAVRPDWLDRRREEIIDPDLPIVDPHHHLVERPETGRYLLPELLADIGGGHNVTATVYLEWLSMYRAHGPAEMRPVGEVEFANGVAAMAASGGYGKTQVCAGIVGYADLTLGAPVEKVLEAQIAAGGGRFRGIRFIAATHPDQAQWGSTVHAARGYADGPRVREGFARLAPLGLSFDAWLYHTQLGDLVDLARAFPETRSCSTMSAARSGSAAMPASATRSSPTGGRDPRAGEVPERPHQARRARHADVRLQRPHP